MKTLLTWLLACPLLLGVSACGGGGGGEDGDVGGDVGATPQLLGPLLYSELKVRSQGVILTEAGPVQVDADGVMTGEVAFYRLFPAPPEPISATRLEIEPVDGAVRNLDGVNAPIRIGGLGTGNHVATLAAVDDFPRMLVLTRPATGLSNSRLDGRYHFTLFSPSDAHSIWGRVDLDGRGAGSFPTAPESNLDGELQDPLLRDLSYQVQADGSTEVIVRAGDAGSISSFTLDGAVANAGRLVTATRTEGGLDDGALKPMVFAAVRAAQNADTSTFSGRYWLTVFLARSLPAEMEFTTLRGTLDADGLGGCIVNGTTHRGDGAFAVLVNEPATYTVAPDGTLEIVFRDADLAMTGGLDAQGRHAVLGGSQIATLRSCFGLLARQP